MAETLVVHSQVQQYYGKTLQSSADLQTGCCTASAPPSEHRQILKLIDDEILTRFYGCGSPIPDVLDGMTVLDLGCGTGRDCYLLSRLVGPGGTVIGVDMTDEQLDVGKRYRDGIMKRFGYSTPNVDFRKGYIEDLAACGIADKTIDVIVSNCVLNLSPDKPRLFEEIFRVLKPGGELYFSDVYADRRIPDGLRKDPVFHGECLGGALYKEDFRRLVATLGCPDSRLMESQTVAMNNDAMAAKAGNIEFVSATIRAFKLDSLEDRCEDYGQIATYKGTITNRPHRFTLDSEHVFETGRPTPVCGNTASMLTETRFNEHFHVLGNRSTHYGLFQSYGLPGGEPVAPRPAAIAPCC
ncbi:MAG: methyltransferase domain-containing protein [Verrucomicrobia bacterium]|nr:methyltransferase domain-containing protein [Verrucomicrobiota bacterium]